MGGTTSCSTKSLGSFVPGCCAGSVACPPPDPEHVSTRTDAAPTNVHAQLKSGEQQQREDHEGRSPKSYADHAERKPITARCFFPTFCLPMQKFDGLERMKAHEAIFDELVIPRKEDLFFMHFISHEWLGFVHPDPDGTQLRHMQRVFKKFALGDAKSLFDAQDFEAFLEGVSSTTGASLRSTEQQMLIRSKYQQEHLQEHVQGGIVWLDYHSIPQAAENNASSQFIDAVNSIPYYVELCDYFWVCAPRAVHHDLQESRDYHTWKGRGWCRLEDITNLLSRTLKMPLIVTSQPCLATYGFLDGLQALYGRPERSVANGQFTCCRFDHKVPQPDGTVKHIACDKHAIAPVLISVFESLFKHNCNSGAQSSLRRTVLHTSAPSIFAGFEEKLGPEHLGWIPPTNESVPDFLQRLGIASPEERDMRGYPPLMYAALSAQMCVCKELLRLEPGSVLEGPVLGFAVHRPAEEYREMLDLIPQPVLEQCLDMAYDRGRAPLDRAALYGCDRNVRILLEMGAYREPRRHDDGRTPLLSAAMAGYPLCCKVLLEYRADVTACDVQGDTALHLAARPLEPTGNPEKGAKLEVIALLLEARANSQLVGAHGQTALQIATNNAFSEAVELLSLEEVMP